MITVFWGRSYQSSWLVFVEITQRYHKENNLKNVTFKKPHGLTLTRHILIWAFCLSVLSFSPPAFERGHCYEPYLQNGNFTTSDPLYGVGAVIQFSCDPGHSLEQGPPVIECISARDPYWNDTEPLCKGNTEGRKQRQCASCNNIFLFSS